MLLSSLCNRQAAVGADEYIREARGYNIFRLLGIEHYEELTHSRMLYNLLWIQRQPCTGAAVL
jgi:hypothetical protein